MKHNPCWKLPAALEKLLRVASWPALPQEAHVSSLLFPEEQAPLAAVSGWETMEKLSPPLDKESQGQILSPGGVKCQLCDSSDSLWCCIFGTQGTVTISWLWTLHPRVYGTIHILLKVATSCS